MNSSELSKLLSFVIGDGYITKSDRIEFEHGSKQKDYLEWKHKYLSDLFGISNRICHRKRIIFSKEHTSYNFGFSLKKKFNLGGIRKSIYGNSNRKNYLNILNQCDDPYFLLAIWLGDDGMVRRRVTNNVTNSSGLDIASFDQTEEENQKIVEWFQTHVGITPKVKKMFSSKKQKYWYYIGFTQVDSMYIWHKVRNILLPIPSMAHKFRHIEEKYTRSFSYLEYNPSASPQRPTNKKYELSEICCSLQELIDSYKELNSSYKVAAKYNLSATAVKRMLKEAGVLRTQSKAVVEGLKI